MKRTLILLGLTTVVLFLLSRTIASTYGPDVAARFAETLKDIPSVHSATLGEATFLEWLSNPSNKRAIAAYAFPVLSPMDFLFLTTLGLFLGNASVVLASLASWRHSIPVWVWWILPILYVIFDFAEDVVLVAILTHRASVALWYSPLHVLTISKIISVTLAIGQAVLLSGLILYSHFALSLRSRS